MRLLLKVMFGAAAALVAAVAVFVGLTLPPRAVRLSATGDTSRLAWGAYHVHSSRSDGSGSPDDIAAAAARAGLQFVIVTDHGDATRPADPPLYRQGVLCIDAVEIGSVDGHVVALNLQRASAYPLAGETRDVVEDIHRLGGWAVAAHPDSPKAGLRWRAPDVAVDGIEWLSADSQWRAHPATSLVATAARALVRGPEAIGSLFQPPTRSLQRWDTAQRRGPVFSLGALDAHARLGADDGAYGGGGALKFPGYASLFRTLAQVVVLEGPLTGDAVADARSVLGAIGAGRSYSVVRAFAEGLPPVTFSATYADGRAEMGGQVPAGRAATMLVETPGIADARLVLRRDGRDVAQGRGRVELAAPPEPAVYRAEAYIGGHQVPWVVTNAIRVGQVDVLERPQTGQPAQGRPGGTVPSSRSVPSQAWRIEKDASSTATITEGDAGVRVRYRLGSGTPAGQFVALVVPADDGEALAGLEFTASSVQPMRLSVQVRVAGGPDGRRWRRSIYVDSTARTASIRLADLDPVDRQSPLRPVVARVQSVLWVVDTLNARPGQDGEFLLRHVRLIGGRPGDAAGRRP